MNTYVARCGNSIGVKGSTSNAGMLGCFLRLEMGNQWKTLGLTCHHVVLPTYPSARLFELYGIKPKENPAIYIDIPHLLDHQQTIENHKATIKALYTEEQEIIGTWLADTSDCLIPSECREYDAV